jgi:hypothetical protein
VALITLAQDILESQIDGQPLVLLPGNITSVFKFVTVQKMKGQGNVVVIGFFDKKTVGEAINVSGDVEVKVAGKLKSGQCFYGADTIKILDE